MVCFLSTRSISDTIMLLINTTGCLTGVYLFKLFFGFFLQFFSALDSSKVAGIELAMRLTLPVVNARSQEKDVGASVDIFPPSSLSSPTWCWRKRTYLLISCYCSIFTTVTKQ